MFSRARRLLVLAALAFPGLAVAQTSISWPDPIAAQSTQTFGMVGLTAGQTVRLNVLNGVTLVSPASAASPIATVCSAQLSFLDSTGKTLKTESVSVPAGQSSSFDLNRDTDLTTTAERVEIRAIIQMPAILPPGATPPTPVPLFCTLIPTLELFDNSTGKTTAVLESTRIASGAIVTPIVSPVLPGTPGIR